MLVVLKIPIVYLAAVVWWAIRSEPVPEGGQGQDEAFAPLVPCAWGGRRHDVRRPTGMRPLRPGSRPSRRPRVGVSS